MEKRIEEYLLKTMDKPDVKALRDKIMWIEADLKRYRALLTYLETPKADGDEVPIDADQAIWQLLTR